VGELFGLVGPDGAGKTTLLRMLAGVLRPSAGDAVLDGVSVARDPEG
jgi:ABC-2 type transport system ATP-binding protein